MNTGSSAGALPGTVIETTNMVSMRDGTRLSTDLYFPARQRQALPTVLTRTPYDKRKFRDSTSELWKFVEAGFVVAVQDLRGTFESEGDCRVSEHERHDGHDTVVWLAGQAWSNGRVGTYGCSHRGEVQYQLAAERPPGLACMIAQAGGSILSGETARSYIHMGGAVNLGIAPWYRTHQNTVRPQFPRGTPAELIRQASAHHSLAPVQVEMRYPQDLQHLPIIDILDRVGSPPSEWRDMVSHAPGDPWWQRKGHVTRRDVLDVPILHVNSWFDFGVQETLMLAEMVRQHGGSERTRRNQFVLVSAAGHCGSEKLVPGAGIGELDLGDPSFNAFGLYIRWFRHWLEGPGDDYPDQPYIRYFLLNRNAWREAPSWPPPGAVPTAWYLSSRHGAQSLHGDGRLHTTPAGDAGSDSFVYDPLNPVPTAGGVMWSPGTPPAVPIGPVDQRAAQVRQDVLVYTSPPFARAQEVVGPISAALWVRSSAPDTDFTAKLSVVLPDGRALWLSEGILRLRYWAGLDQARPVPPGSVTPIRIDLKAIAFEIQPGSCVRLEVSSSNFPRFERNLNTGGNNFDECTPVTAVNTVMHGPLQPSCLSLCLRAAS
ncbi:MAG: CocE/NonD family hydrolase [Rubrivivax sp.]|nr:CocE/NonD family hydrolase [Rubrivivax sp.]